MTTATKTANHRTNTAGKIHGKPSGAKLAALTESQVIGAKLAALGYEFSLNSCTSEIYIGPGKVLDDGTMARIRVQLRDFGFKNARAVEDVYISKAFENQFHPIKDYLEAQTWDGNDHIRALSDHLKDSNGLIVNENKDLQTVSYCWLKRWLIGSVAKFYSNKAQNPILVLAGGQDLGKSSFIRWLCPISELHTEERLNPDNKEVDRYLAAKWIWEVPELGATTRRADREALKALLTKQDVTYRVPYARHSVKRPVTVSFAGTINPEGNGFLSDPTGNRRFLVVDLISIDWDYEKKIDVNQVWAQAFALFKQGEPWRLTKEEIAMRDTIADSHMVIDTAEEMILRFFDIEPTRNDWRMTTTAIAQLITKLGFASTSDRELTTRIGIALRKLGVEKSRPDPRQPWMNKGIQLKEEYAKRLQDDDDE